MQARVQGKGYASRDARDTHSGRLFRDCPVLCCSFLLDTLLPPPPPPLPPPPPRPSPLLADAPCLLSPIFGLLLSSNSATYVCDTIPTPRLGADKSCSRSPSPGPDSAPPVSVTTFDPPLLAPKTAHEQSTQLPTLQPMAPSTPAPAPTPSDLPSQPPGRKLCVRHPCMADEGTNLKLQQALNALSVAKRKAVSAIWSSFSSSLHPQRTLLLQDLLSRCCFSQLSFLTEQLVQLICVDPFAISPREVSLKILGHLDIMHKFPLEIQQEILKQTYGSHLAGLDDIERDKEHQTNLHQLIVVRSLSHAHHRLASPLPPTILRIQ
ncbi:hypothetical protein C8Q78DRAFT_1083679 [Trametes maxima]|nr:hypothetical protein C8Q78DRAFT_1083679 [Trametes maxima]